MKDETAVGPMPSGALAPRVTAATRARDHRRWLQLALGLMWLLDGMLQFQPAMFTTAFADSLAETAAGNPPLISTPILWAVGIIGRHPAGTNAVFATIQVLLGLGLLWRPTVKPALAGSVAWSLAVWWLGEGLGGILNGTASPVSGAPGAAVLYGLLAVVLWPSGTRTAARRPARSVAERSIGPAAARGLWLLLWGSLAYLALLPGNTSAQGLHDMLSGMVSGQPGWLAWAERHAADLAAHRGLPIAAVLAALLAAVAAGALLPAPVARVSMVLAVALSLIIWVVGEAMGELFGGQATDPNSGPLLVLLALAYWPLRDRPGIPDGQGLPQH